MTASVKPLPVKRVPPSALLETITPAEAEAILKTKQKNRPITPSRVIEYAVAIDQGDWVVNGEAIKIDKDGHLIDGQHRLEACALAGKPLTTYVIRGITDARAFATIDVGKPRTHGDIFALTGFSSPHEASSAAMVVYGYRNGMLGTKGFRQFKVDAARRLAKGTKYSNVGSPKIVPKEELVAFAANIRDGLNEAVTTVHRHKVAKLMSRSIAAALYFLFCEKNKADAETFFEQLGSGVGLAPPNPIYYLREKLISNATQTARLPKFVVMLMVVKTWNNIREGRSARATRIMENETFPKIK